MQHASIPGTARYGRWMGLLFQVAESSMNAKQAKLLDTQDHRALAIWAAGCAEDVLAYFFRSTFGQSCFPAGTRTENVRGEVRIVAYSTRHDRPAAPPPAESAYLPGRERRGTQLWRDID